MYVSQAIDQPHAKSVIVAHDCCAGCAVLLLQAQSCQFLGSWADGSFVEGKWVSQAGTDTCMRPNFKLGIGDLTLAAGSLTHIEWRAAVA
jgi:hypothetical protein